MKASTLLVHGGVRRADEHAAMSQAQPLPLHPISM